jgi:hypothetical protein
VALQQLPDTTNFSIFWEDTIPNAQTRAQAISDICDHELGVLNGWFGISNAFGPSDRIKVYLDRPDNSGAQNFGYQGGGNSNIHLDVQSGNNSATNAAAEVRMLFINELVEVLMSYNDQHQGKTIWNAGDSAGEGLSQLLGIERFRAGHYLYYPSFVDAWLQTAGRPDWVTTSEGTDTKSVSFGCALLFLYYLKSQLGHSVPAIIQKAGPTLEETFTNLTGQKGAFNAFNGLVSAYFPPGQTPKFNSYDNPFPLYGPGLRQVSLDWSTSPSGAAFKVASGEATVQPFFFCPGGTYHFDILGVPQRLDVTATTHGFGQPVFSWLVNGVSLEPGDSISVQGAVTVNDAADPQKHTTGIQTVKISSSGSASGTKGYLRLFVDPAVVGHVDLTIDVKAAERYMNPTVATAETGWAQVDTEVVQWEDQYYQHQDDCRRRWHEFIDRFSEFRYIDIIRTLPDPPPDYNRTVRMLVIVAEALAAAREEQPELGDAAERALEPSLGLSLEDLDVVVRQFNQGIG